MREVHYEVRLSLDPAIATKFDAWLADHVDAMLALPGFRKARLITPEPDGNGRVQRIVRYQVASREALDRYFRDHSAHMRAEGEKRFGGRFQAQRAIYPKDPNRTVPEEARCPNCHAVAEGAWCPVCGQEQTGYRLAFDRLALDYLGDTFMFDSRLFRSLKLLVFQPGRLTRENLIGRRARYIPALRLYLFSALVFFALSTVMMDWTTENSAEGFARGAAAIRADIKADENVTAWERTIADMSIKAMQEPDAFMRIWLNNISLAMLAFLPFYALLLKLLYVRSSFYYLEHLIFALHIHAFVFIGFSATVLYTSYLEPFTPQLLDDVLAIALTAGVVFYALPALKHVYRQSWPMSTAKFLVLGLIYVPIVLLSVFGVMVGSLYYI